MLQKKPSPDLLVPERKKLESLYAYRRALDTLIHSLEQYYKFRVRSVESRKAKTA